MSLSKSRMKGSGEKKYQTQILGDKLNLKDLPANMQINKAVSQTANEFLVMVPGSQDQVPVYSQNSE